MIKEKVKLLVKVLSEAKKIQITSPEKSGIQCLEEAKIKYHEEIVGVNK